MMNQKDIWKQEADQLKKDLDARKKVVKKNEVPIQFGKTPTRKASQNQEKSHESNSDLDQHFRSFLNI